MYCVGAISPADHVLCIKRVWIYYAGNYIEVMLLAYSLWSEREIRMLFDLSSYKASDVAASSTPIGPACVYRMCILCVGIPE